MLTSPSPTTTRERMDALVDGHYRAEEAGDLGAIVEGFAPGAEHDVAGRPGGVLHGGDAIAGFYAQLLADLRIERFEPVRRLYGEAHVVDEAVLHATAIGHPFGLDGRNRPVSARMLHVFEFAADLIASERAWLDLAAIHQQLAD